jgi:hypothetical protein
MKVTRMMLADRKKADSVEIKGSVWWGAVRRRRWER